MIPKTLHIIWVGDDGQRPDNCIGTWAAHHPGWQIKLWGNDDLESQRWRLGAQIVAMARHDIRGVADLMRWEILLAEGGVAVAADSLCLGPIPEAWLKHSAFAAFENETAAPGLLSAAFVGAEPGAPLLRRLVDAIERGPAVDSLPGHAATGSQRLTAVWQAAGREGLTALPSHSFMPRHPGGQRRDNPEGVVACELWATRMGLVASLHSLDAQAMLATLAASWGAGPATPATPAAGASQADSAQARQQRRIQEVRAQFEAFTQHPEPRFALNWEDRHLCLDDNTSTTGFDRHYIFHPAWAARVLAQSRPAKHMDIGSSLQFATQVSAFLPVEFYDVRPAPMDLPGLVCGQANLTQLPFPSGNVESVSCMHVVEHVGLARYGDQLDYDGDLKAVAELRRVTAPGGQILFVVPIGAPRIQFNAHRIYSYRQVLEMFAGFELKQYALIPDHPRDGDLVVGASEAMTNAQRYACGCFWFVRPRAQR